MVDNVKENAYIRYAMSNLPEVKAGSTYVLKNGDSLWNIARNEISKNKEKKASNKEISEYMLLIAKLNNLDTVEKMNGLKYSQQILLPENNPLSAANNSGIKSKTDAEKSIDENISTLKNDKSVYAVKASLGRTQKQLYHVFNSHKYPNGYTSTSHPVMSFNVDKSGKVVEVTFNDINDKNPIKYDYKLDNNGTITVNDGLYRKKQGQISKEKFEELEGILLNISKDVKVAY